MFDLITHPSLNYHAGTTWKITWELRKTRDDKSVEFSKCSMTPVNLLPGAISEMIACVTDTCRLTQADRYGLLAALLDDSTPEEDLAAINRMLYSLRRGRIEVVNELSSVM